MAKMSQYHVAYLSFGIAFLALALVTGCGGASASEHYQRALVAQQAGDPEKALKEFDAAKDYGDARQNSVELQDTLASIRSNYDEAKKAIDKGDWSGAESLLSAIVENYPGFRDAKDLHDSVIGKLGLTHVWRSQPNGLVELRYPDKWVLGDEDLVEHEFLNPSADDENWAKGRCLLLSGRPIVSVENPERHVFGGNEMSVAGFEFNYNLCLPPSFEGLGEALGGYAQWGEDVRSAQDYWTRGSQGQELSSSTGWKRCSVGGLSAWCAQATVVMSSEDGNRAFDMATYYFFWGPYLYDVHVWTSEGNPSDSVQAILHSLQLAQRTAE